MNLGSQPSRPPPRGNDSDYLVLTPERVSLQYEVAGIGSRSAAAMVDVALQGAVLAVMLLIFALMAGLFGGAGRSSGGGAVVASIGVAALVLGTTLVLWGYYLFFEIVWSGQTPGKRLVGIRVVRENGYPLRPADAVVRNLVRILDGPPAGAAIGLLVMLLNSRAKRLGDFAAGTIVVREGARGGVAALASLDAAIGKSPAEGVSPSQASPVLSPADATLVRDFLARRAQLDGPARARLANRLAAGLAERYGLQAQLSTSSEEDFLQRLVGR